ncbi:MAG: HNH endonuclease [Candidatus Methanoperedens sp.]|nr:HNH endonuclease [Candidatus Methanoperedens sp.]
MRTENFKPLKNRTIEERFWEKVDKRGDDECWNWKGAKNHSLDLSKQWLNGYGTLWKVDKKIGAHRISYEINCGIIPDGLCVLHKCDNSSCVNPNHLFLGTKSDNAIDSVSKNRNRDNTGENNGRAKLTWEKSNEIRKLYDSGFSYRNIAKMFNISHFVVSQIVKGKLWRTNENRR